MVRKTSFEVCEVAPMSKHHWYRVWTAAWAMTSAAGICSAATPVVSSVTAMQRTDGSRSVDIRYNLSHAEGRSCSISLKVSSDDGATWTVPVTAVSGAIGPGIPPGVGKLIVWDSQADQRGAFGSQFRARVCADDGQGPPPPESMVLIPAGEFLMGNSFSGEGWPEELPRHAVSVRTFYMDRTEVTNQQYAAGLNWALAQGNQISVINGIVYKFNSGTNYPYCGTNPTENTSRITWDGSTFGVVTGKENHPMVNVSWYGSTAYANWRSAMHGRPLCYSLSTWECSFTPGGYRLPTEAE